METIIYKNIEYNGDNLYQQDKIWRRKDKVYKNCNDELIGNIKYLTSEYCINNPNYILSRCPPLKDYDSDDDDNKLNMICICGYPNCGKLFIVIHTPTDTEFAVGSSCISKFKPKDYDLIGRKYCKYCNNGLWYRTTKNRKSNATRNSLICNNCSYKLSNSMYNTGYWYK
jgi:hypothetical protein